MFYQIGDRAGKFPSDRQSLEKSTAHEGERREEPDGLIGRQQADTTGRDRHENDRPGQRVAAAHRIAPITEEQCAERSGQKSDREDSEGGKQRHRRLFGWKEQGGEHRGKVAIEREVIPFQHVADRAGQQDLATKSRRRDYHDGIGSQCKRLRLTPPSPVTNRSWKIVRREEQKAVLVCIQDPNATGGEKHGPDWISLGNGLSAWYVLYDQFIYSWVARGWCLAIGKMTFLPLDYLCE